MKSISYAVGQTYTNEKNGKMMTITGKHRAGNQRGAKTIWHIEVDGVQYEKDSDQIKRFFLEEKKAYTGSASGRVVLSKEAIEKKVAGELQRCAAGMKYMTEVGFFQLQEDGLYHFANADDWYNDRIKHYTEEALRIEAEKKAKAEASAKERQAKKESLDILKNLTPEQLKAIVAGLKK